MLLRMWACLLHVQVTVKGQVVVFDHSTQVGVHGAEGRGGACDDACDDACYLGTGGILWVAG